jgi:competence protein ComFC
VVVRPIDLLLPPRCAICQASGPIVCAHCLVRLPHLGAARCLRCGAPGIREVVACSECRGRRLGFSSARAAIAYDDAGRLLVHRLKDGGLRRLAELAAGLLALHRPETAADHELVTWVPGDRWRTIRRGYHPPELMARELAARSGLPAGPLLRARGPRRPQRGLATAERRRNVRDAFRVVAVPPASVLLVDDVYTTGATLSACAGALRRAGCRRVDAVTLARTVRW